MFYLPCFPSSKAYLGISLLFFCLLSISDTLAQNTVPRLSKSDGVHMSEAGPGDNSIYLNPQKKSKGLVLFVDFKDIKGPANLSSNFQNILNFDYVDFFFEQQAGKELIDFTFKNSTWRSLPKNAHEYQGAFGDPAQHKSFVETCLSLYPDENPNNYDFLVVITAQTPTSFLGSASMTLPKDAKFNIPISPSTRPDPTLASDQLDRQNTKSLRAAATMGNDIYQSLLPDRRLIHEIGHLYGLPDLYPRENDKSGDEEQDSDYSKAGCWGIMSDADRAGRFLMWHNHILGWRVNPLYITSSQNGVILSATHTSASNMIVIPWADLATPSKVLVIEKAPRIVSRLNLNKRVGGSGYIVYTVDASIPTGESPIEVYCRKITVEQEKCQEISRDFGRKFKANVPLNEDFIIVRPEDGAQIKIKSTSKDPINKTLTLDITISPRTNVQTELKKRSVSAYRTLKFGDLIWLADDLVEEVDESLCFQDNPNHCIRYGRMYTWAGAKKACAQLGDGWRLPSDTDWKELTRAFGGAYGDQTFDPPASTYQQLIEGGEARFNAQLGGKKYHFLNTGIAYFYDLHRIGYYWTSEARDPDNVLSYTFRSNDQLVLRETITPRSYSGCRCVKDDE